MCMIGKKPKPVTDRASWSGIAIKTPKPYPTIRKWAVFEMKTPLQATATKETKAKTRNYVIVIHHTYALSVLDARSIRPE